MRIFRASEHLGGLVHEIRKGFDGAGKMLCQRIGAFVAGTHHGGGHQVIQAHHLACRDRNGGIGGRNQVDGILGNDHFVILQIAHLQGNVGRQDFRRGGGVHDLVCVLFKNDFAGICFNHDGAPGIEHIGIQHFRMALVPGNGIFGKARRNEFFHRLFFRFCQGGKRQKQAQREQK